MVLNKIPQQKLFDLQRVDLDLEEKQQLYQGKLEVVDLFLFELLPIFLDPN